MKTVLLLCVFALAATEAAAKRSIGRVPTAAWNFTYGAQYQAQQDRRCRWVWSAALGHASA